MAAITPAERDRLKRVVKDYHEGEPTSSEDLRLYIKKAESVLPFLESHGELYRLVSGDIRQRMIAFEGFLRARKVI